MVLAYQPLAEQLTSIHYELARLDAMSQWWHWLLLLAACLAVTVWIAVAYYYDAVELPRAIRWLLFGLRLAAFAGILFYFFDLEKRSERKLVKVSRVVLLVDTSQSMGLSDADATSVPAGPSRIEHVVAELEEGDLLEKLRAENDVVVYRFDQGNRPVEIAAFSKRSSEATAALNPASAVAATQQVLSEARWLAIAAGVLLIICLIAGLVALVSGRRASTTHEETSWALLVSIVSLIFAVVLLAVADLRSPGISLARIVGLQTPELAEQNPDGLLAASEATPLEPEIDWQAELLPRGVETRIGEALRYVINKERGGPIGGIVLLTDGRSNAGIEVSAPLAAARAAGIPIYTVGLGSDRRPVNVRVVDLEAPPRVFPGDRFSMTGYLQSHGLKDRMLRLQLLSQPAGSSGQQNEVVETESRIRLGDDGEVMPVRFEVTPDEQGQRIFKLRIEAPSQDYDQRDNEKTAKVDIIERKNRVLLLAGGPTREYRFLRNLLYRDRDTTLHVLLQSGTSGISQESDELLLAMPSTAEEMFEYDCVVAFDPDWQSIAPESIRLLERWVSEGAGGMVLIAGPVFTSQWSRASRSSATGLDLIHGLYPVQLYTRGSPTLNFGRFEADSAWPLQFTREGLESEFLWLDDEPLASEQKWASFGGIYGYYAVRGPKPGARVLARFADPSTAIDGDLPIYLAAHFYGAGRVFFQASGEMWRLRSVDEALFERYYTKLIRWVSEGRLLRDSSRGVLLVDKERCLLGDRVGVRAMLNDPQHRPLTLEQVSAVLIQPDSTRVPIVLERVQNAARPGMYASQFTALQEGDYRIELPVPQSTGEFLTREVRVRVPTLEVEQPQRNDALLKDLAQKTGGQYYVGLPAAVGRTGSVPPLVNSIEPQDQVTYLPGTPDRDFQQTLMAWLMGIISGALCLEWLIRRLWKLA